MNRVKLALYLILALLVVLLAGYLWGGAGRSALQARLDDTELRLDLSEGRADLLAARVAGSRTGRACASSLFEVNFGRASQHLQAAKSPLQDAEKRLTDGNRNDEAGRVREVAARVTQAQDQAGRVDQSANTRLAEAIALLEQVIAGGKPQD